MFFLNIPFQNRHITNIVININEIKVNKSTTRFIIGGSSVNEIATLRDAFFLDKHFRNRNNSTITHW